MGKPIVFCLFVFVVASLLPSAAAREPEAESSVAAEVAAMKQSLDRLVSLLESAMQYQRVDVVFKHLELKERRVAPMERRVREIQEDISSQEIHLKQLAVMLEHAEGEKDELQRRNAPSEAVDTQIAEIETAIRMESTRLEDLKRMLVDADNDLASSRKEIAILDEMLREMLE